MEVIIICFNITNEKTVMEVKQPLSSSAAVSPAEYKHEFSRMVKILAASIVPGDQNPLIVVKYHDSILNKCHIKTFKVSA